MAFDGHQSTFADSLFPTYQRQASVNGGGRNTGNMALPFVSIPSGSLQNASSYMPWSQNAHDDPYELISCAETGTKSRKSTDNTDCDGETDLQGLVSNILDEADSQDSYFSEGNLNTCNPIWSPNTLREELLQYFQSEAKVQHNPTLSPNYVSHDGFGKVQGQSLVRDVEEIYQQSNGLTTNQQCFINLPNRDGDSYRFHRQKVPPGLSLPNTGNTQLLQMQKSKYDMSADKDRRDSQPMINFPEISDVFRPQREMNSPFFGLYSEDLYSQSSTRFNSNEQNVPQDINQLLSRFQSFVTGERGSLCHGDFPHMHKQTAGLHHEDTAVEHCGWKITSPPMSTQSTPAIQTPKQLGGEFGILQRERYGGVRKPTFNYDAFQDLPGCSPHNIENIQQPKSFSASLNYPNQYHNKTAMHRESVNMTLNQYSKHHLQQGHNQNRSKQQDKKMMHMAGFLGDSFSARPQTNNHIRERDKKQVLSQKPYFDFQGSMQSQRFDGENNIVCAENTHQFMPLMYPVNDPRRNSSIPISSNLSSIRTLSYGSGVAGLDVGDVVLSNESAGFNSYITDLMTHRAEGTHHGMATAVPTPLMSNQRTHVNQLYFYLDECYEQWKSLEKERKTTEVILSKTFLGKQTTTLTNTNQLKTPPNPTRVDHLIVKQFREQAKVASLLERMECLRNTPFHMNIHTALSKNHKAICITQARRKEETANVSKHQQQRAHFTEDRDTLFLVSALKDLSYTTRKLRTALWCALQMTLPKPVKKQDQQAEVTSTERCSSPVEGYFFKL